MRNRGNWRTTDLWIEPRVATGDPALGFHARFLVKFFDSAAYRLVKAAMDDRQLIQRFAADGSEEAFGQLVARHINFVFSVAQRLLGGDCHRAQDVAQLVFINLARKAPGLWGHQRRTADPEPLVLSGWLHRDTYFTALEMLRRDRRRNEREREAMAMNELERDPGPVNWHQMAPVLDEALNSLAPTDRDALLLRFFEQRSLVEIGERLGIGESGASHRVARALEKLRLLLARYGITTTTAALSASIATHGMQMAPAGLTPLLTRASLIAAANSSTSPLGILTLMISTKLKSTLAILAVLALTSGVAVIWPRATPNRDGRAAHTFPVKGKAAMHRRLPLQGVASRTSAVEAMDPGVAAALRKVREALVASGETRLYPQTAMEDALAALGKERKAALPLLREALHDAEGRVRQRAMGGLWLLRNEAAEARPDLMDVIRDGPRDDAEMAVRALGFIGPSAEMAPALIQALKADPSLRSQIFPILTMVNYTDPSKVNEVADYIRPLLKEADPGLRLEAAYAFAALKRQEAGTEVLPIAIQTVKSNANDTDVRMALSVLGNIYSDGKSSVPVFVSNSLSAACKDAIPALIDIANNNKREDIRFKALWLLDGLQPGLRPANPPMDTALKEQEQVAAFEASARSGQVSVPELIGALNQYPKSVPTIAGALAALGPNAHEALPALRDELIALEPKPDATMRDRRLAALARNVVADAIQAIAPDQPKPRFTQKDADGIMRIIDEYRQQADLTQGQRIGEALVSACPVPFEGLTPDQLRGLLRSLKGIDGTLYNAVTAQVGKSDPHFSTKP